MIERRRFFGIVGAAIVMALTPSPPPFRVRSLTKQEQKEQLALALRKMRAQTLAKRAKLTYSFPRVVGSPS